MRRSSLAFASLLIILAFATGTAFTWHSAGGNSYQVTASVYFSPLGGCTDAITTALAGARKTVLVQAYSFTSAPIAKALLAAKKRGVAVQVILDKSQRTEKYSEADFFAHMGIPTFIDAAHAIAHNKIMIIDGETIITGSFNFTRAAESQNAENLLVIHSKELAARYTANWQEHRGHSQAYSDHQQCAPVQSHASRPSPGAGQGQYIGNTNSKIFHLPTCLRLPTPENRIVFHSREEAVQAGYRPCKRCNP